MMSSVAIHQVLDSLAAGSAVTNCALSAQEILRSAGYRSGIRARAIEPGLGRVARLAAKGRRTLYIYHLSVGSPLSAWVAQRAQREAVILWYHNLTPPGYLQASDPWLAARLEAGREELRRLASVCRGAIADSEYNAQELRACGYRQIEIVPPIFLDARYQVEPDPAILSRYDDGRPNWLFVGRLAPNKRQSDVIAAFAAYRRLAPGARLLLVGSDEGAGTYRRWLENLIAFLGLQDAVCPLGHLSQAELNACYRVARCFVSLSDHEGFGVPLVESMYFGVPVIAYAAAAVPETLGSAGILVKERNPYLVAELAYLLDTDQALRQAVLAGQRQRLADFAYEKVAGRLLAAVERFLAAGGLD